MYRSPNPMPEDSRRAVAAALNAVLADGLDLHGQIKVAHWNLKGPHFAELHPLLETFAVSLAAHNDSVAERAGSGHPFACPSVPGSYRPPWAPPTDLDRE